MWRGVDVILFFIFVKLGQNVKARGGGLLSHLVVCIQASIQEEGSLSLAARDRKRLQTVRILVELNYINQDHRSISRTCLYLERSPFRRRLFFSTLSLEI